MKNNKGFTLIEAIMGIVLVGVTGLVFAGYIVAVTNNWVFLSGQKSVSLSARAALYKMVRELRRVDGNVNISTFEAASITFKDVDGVTITFSQTGANLMRNSDVLFNSMKDPGGIAFTYLKADGGAASSNDQIAIIRVRLSALKGQNKFVMESSAWTRPRTL